MIELEKTKAEFAKEVDEILASAPVYKSGDLVEANTNAKTALEPRPSTDGEVLARLRLVASARADLNWLYLDHLRTHLGPADQRMVRQILAKLLKATAAETSSTSSKKYIGKTT